MGSPHRHHLSDVEPGEYSVLSGRAHAVFLKRRHRGIYRVDLGDTRLGSGPFGERNRPDVGATGGLRRVRAGTRPGHRSFFRDSVRHSTPRTWTSFQVGLQPPPTFAYWASVEDRVSPLEDAAVGRRGKDSGAVDIGVWLHRPAVVPEPATLLLPGSALAGLAAGRRRRRSR